MTKRQTKNNYSKLEKVLTSAGLLLIAVGFIANLYSAYTNLRFIHDTIDVAYYLRYIIILGGGFAIGFLLVKDREKSNSLFRGSVYAALAMTLFWLFDLMRLGIMNLLGFPSFPWGKIIFEGGSLIAVTATLLIAYFSQFKSKLSTVSKTAKYTLIASFVMSQGYYLVTSILMSGESDPAWAGFVLSYLTHPLLITIIAFLLLKNIKEMFSRIFYSVIVGVFFFTLTIVLWEFQTNTHYDNIVFSGVTSIIVALALIAVLLWQARKAVK
jgi:hypothetical protein